MPAGLSESDITAAGQGDTAAIERLFNQGSQILAIIQRATGVDASVSQNQATGGGSTAIPSPPDPGIDVQAVGSVFTVQITSPNVATPAAAGVMPGSSLPAGDPLGPNVARANRRPVTNPKPDSNTMRRIIYQLQAASDAGFSADLRQWGPDTMLWYVIPMPAVSRFWRVRARYENSNFGKWIAFNGAVATT